MITSQDGIIIYPVRCHVMVKMIPRHVPRNDIVLKIPKRFIFVDMGPHPAAAEGAAAIARSLAAAASFVLANASAARVADFELGVGSRA